MSHSVFHYYPFHVRINGRRCLVVGGGKVASRRIGILLSCGARLKVVAPLVDESVAALAREGKIELKRRHFSEEDLDGQFLVLALTDDRELNERIWKLCAHRGILCSGNGISGHGDFIFPSVLKKGEVTLSISTGGGSPTLSRWIREELDHVLAEEIPLLAELLSRVRVETQKGGLRLRYEDWKSVIDEGVLEGLRRGDTETENRILLRIRERAADKPSLCLWGMSHKTSPLHMREWILKRLPPEQELLNTIADKLSNTFLLSTCNRLEIWAFCQEKSFREAITGVIERFAEGKTEELLAHSYFMFNGEAMEHLLRVTSGLDSAALGELQIRNQVKRAVRRAAEAGYLCFPLNRLVEHALRESKRINCLLREGQETVSVSELAVRRLLKETGPRPKGMVLVVGTGEAGREICYRLRKFSDCRLALVGGNRERVRGLSSRFGATPLSYEDLAEALLEADAVLSASPKSDPLISVEDMEAIMSRRDYRPLLVIDISVPRDFPGECGSIPGVTLVGIEDLSPDHALPNGVEKEVRKELDSAVGRMSRFLAEREKTPAIINIRTEAEEICKEEMNRLWRKLDLKDPQKQEIIEETVRKTVNRVLHRPILLIKKEQPRAGLPSRRASGDHLTHRA